MLDDIDRNGFGLPDFIIRRTPATHAIQQHKHELMLLRHFQIQR
jgi:hypothetical protein